MSEIRNIPNEVSQLVEVNRAQIEHRATWMGLIYDEMVRAGIDAEPIIRRAIRQCGRIHGKGFNAACADPGSCVDFRHAFLNDVSEKTFDIRPVKADSDNVKVDFHYCALVSAWQKLGFDDDTIALLCDMAMDGDRGIADAMGLTLDLDDTIAKGCETCKLHFHK